MSYLKMFYSSLCRPLPIFATLMLAIGCAAPRVFVLHSPIQPNNTQPVTYTATAVDTDAVSSIEIWEDRLTLGLCSNGMQCATRVSTSRLTTCTFSPPQSNATCTFTTASGYPDGSFVGYRAVAANNRGRSASDGWIYFAGGAFPWPNNAIPIYATGAPSEKIDLVFIPDPDYGGNNNQFMQDVTSLIANAYLSTQLYALGIRPWRGFWNLYITYQTGDARGYPNGCNTAPSNWTTLRTIVNSGGIVHTQNLRDCSGVGDGSIFSTEPGSFNTAIHETQHSVFSSADEYCCDGGYFELGPEANVFGSQANCQANASAHGWPITDCTQIGTTGWWRSDGVGDLMAGGNSLGRSDWRRVFWMYFDQCAGTAGC